MSMNRRQFERLQLSEEAVAFDETGRRLGLVSHAGGGGMAIKLEDGIPATAFTRGTRLRITVFEPSRNIRNTVDVEVRYISDGSVGFEFAAVESSG